MLQRRKQKKEFIPVRVINTWSSKQNGDAPKAEKKTDSNRMLYCAGQVSTDIDGNLLYPGDMKKQMMQSLDNLEKALKHAGVKLSDVVELTYYATDIAAFTESSLTLMNRLAKAGCKPSTALVEVSSLFAPECLVEFEALAVFKNERSEK